MKDFYAIPEAHALACLDTDQFGRWTLTGINVRSAYRGKGYGSMLLRRVLADADREGVALHAKVASSGPLDDAALIAWYGRYGFRPDPRSVLGPGDLWRPPARPSPPPTPRGDFLRRWHTGKTGHPSGRGGT